VRQPNGPCFPASDLLLSAFSASLTGSSGRDSVPPFAGLFLPPLDGRPNYFCREVNSVEKAIRWPMLFSAAFPLRLGFLIRALNSPSRSAAKISLLCARPDPSDIWLACKGQFGASCILTARADKTPNLLATLALREESATNAVRLFITAGWIRARVRLMCRVAPVFSRGVRDTDRVVATARLFGMGFPTSFSDISFAFGSPMLDLASKASRQYILILNR